MTQYFKRYTAHYRSLLTMGVPIMVGQLGIILTGFVDNIMVGHHMTDELSAASFVNNIFLLPLMFATGFAMGINRILVALEKQKKLPSPSRLDCVVGAEAGCFTSAVQYAEEMRQAGKSCLISFCTNLTDFEGEAREKGAKNNVFFTREERIEITMGGLK